MKRAFLLKNLAVIMAVILLTVLLLPVYAASPDDTNAEQIPIGLSEKIGNLYNWAVSLAGLVALGLIIFGGVVYASSAGNPSRITEAKAWITHALMGLFMLLGAYLILGFINPDLTKLDEVFLAQNVNPQSQTLGLGAGVPGVTWLGGINPGGGGNNTVIMEGGFSCPLGDNFNHYAQGIGFFWHCRTCSPSTPRGEEYIYGVNCGSAVCTRPHIGIDMDSVAVGLPVYAAEDGTVTGVTYWDGESSNGGNILNLSGQHANYAYMHLQSFVVTSGPVRVGQLIAYEGDTGNVAPHLHFEIRSKTIPYISQGEGAGQANYDPCDYLNVTCGGFTCPDRSMYGAGGFILMSGSVTIVPPGATPVAPSPTPPGVMPI